MKNDLKSLFYNFNHSMNEQKFKLEFLLIIITGIYGGCYLSLQSTYINGFITSITSYVFILLIYLILSINTFNTFSLLEQNYSYIIRFKDTKDYIKNIIKNIIFSNTIVFVIIITFLMIFLNLFTSDLGVTNIYQYNISNIIYLIFLLVKLYVIVMLMLVINVYVIKIFNKRVGIFFIALNIISIFVSGEFFSDKIISSILQIHLVPWDYLFPLRYSSFIFEVIFVSFIILLLFCISRILQKISFRYCSQVGE